MSDWTPRQRAAALQRLAGLAARGAPWDATLEALGEAHGEARLAPARRAASEGAQPGAVLEQAGLLSADERRLLEAGALPEVLHELATHARDIASVREGVRNALFYPCARLFSVCLAAGLMWFLVYGGAGTWTQSAEKLVVVGLVVFVGTMIWAVPAGVCWVGWRVPLFRSPIESLLRLLPMVGKIVNLYTAARFWRTLGLGLRLERPLPAAIAATREVFARGSRSYREVDDLVPPAQEGRDLPGLISYLENGCLREEHILRVAQKRGSLPDDVLALAALRREQLLDAARNEGSALLLFADAALMLACAAMLLILIAGSQSSLSPFYGIFFY